MRKKHLSWILFSSSCFSATCMHATKTEALQKDISTLCLHTLSQSFFLHWRICLCSALFLLYKPGIVHPECKSFFFSAERLENLRRPKLQINCFKNKFHERRAWRDWIRVERKKQWWSSVRSLDSVQWTSDRRKKKHSHARKVEALKIYKSRSHAFVPCSKFLVAVVAASCFIFHSWQILKLVFTLRLLPPNYSHYFLPFKNLH